MTGNPPPPDGGTQHTRPRRRFSSARRPRKPLPSAPRRAIRPLLVLVALINLSWSLFQLPVSRVVESRLCHEHYAAHDPSALRPDGTVPEELCKIDAVQQHLGWIQGTMDATWVAGDFLMTVPLVSLADHYGHHFVLYLNVVPRVFLLAWSFAVGYFDQVLPVNAILTAPVFSFLGGGCVFDSIVYALVSELTDDHVLRATFFGYVNAVSSIFASQLGPALASATMSTLLWLPLWMGIALLLLAIPVIRSLPAPLTHHNRKPFSRDEEEEGDDTVPLISTYPAATTTKPSTLKARTTARLQTLLSVLTNPTRNFVLLLSVFFLAAFASSDTKLLPLYISKRYSWKFASVGYLLSVKALFNFFLQSVLIPRFLSWRRVRSRQTPSSSSSPLNRPHHPVRREDDGDGREVRGGTGDREGRIFAAGPDSEDGQNVANAHVCLIFSVLGALAIALSPSVAVLVPALLVYALGIALPMFTYSLLRAPGMGVSAGGDGDGEDGPGTQLFSVVMLVRRVGTLVGAVVMPALWVMGMGVGGWGLGMPFLVSAVCYAVAGGLVRRIVV